MKQKNSHYLRLDVLQKLLQIAIRLTAKFNNNNNNNNNNN